MTADRPEAATGVLDDEPTIRAAVADWEVAVAAEGELRVVEERRRADAERELEKLAVAIARARHDAVQRHVDDQLQHSREG